MTTARSARKRRGVGNAARVVIGGICIGSSMSNGRTRAKRHLPRGTCSGKARIARMGRGAPHTLVGNGEQLGSVKRLRENRCFHPGGGSKPLKCQTGGFC